MNYKINPTAMKYFRTLIPAAALALMASTGFAVTPSNASLNGTYVFHFSNVQEASWYASVSCHYTNITDYYTGGGQSANMRVTAGEMTFNGKGSVTINYTSYDVFNSAASNATVKITCPSSPGAPAITNNGHMVLNPPSSYTVTGTYAVSPNGTASLTLPAGQGGLSRMSLASFTSTGLSTTFLIDSPDNNDINTGIGVHK